MDDDDNCGLVASCRNTGEVRKLVAVVVVVVVVQRGAWTLLKAFSGTKAEHFWR